MAEPIASAASAGRSPIGFGGAARSDPRFANARAIRNLLDEAEGRMAARVSSLRADRLADRDLYLITMEDVPESSPAREPVIGFA